MDPAVTMEGENRQIGVEYGVDGDDGGLVPAAAEMAEASIDCQTSTDRLARISEASGRQIPTVD
eukprot:6203181-Pleurochrysis_carterae.AAC.1